MRFVIQTNIFKQIFFKLGGVPIICHKGIEDGSSTHSKPRRLIGMWSTSRPGRFSFGKESRYPLYKRIGPSGQEWETENHLHSPGFEPRTVQAQRV